MCPRWVEYVSVLRQAYSKNSRPDNEKFVTKRFLFLWAAGKPRQTCQNDEDIGQRMLMFYIELRGSFSDSAYSLERDCALRATGTSQPHMPLPADDPLVGGELA
jgi:hypothetical protein